jgi:hypothetical protein
MTDAEEIMACLNCRLPDCDQANPACPVPATLEVARARRIAAMTEEERKAYYRRADQNRKPRTPEQNQARREAERNRKRRQAAAAKATQ